MTSPQEIKTASVTVKDKAMKEGKNGNYYELTLTKDGRDVKMRCFENNENGFAQCKASVKGQTYEIGFTETQAKGQDGKDITYRNIVSIGVPTAGARPAQVQTAPQQTPAKTNQQEPRREEFPDVKQFRNSIEMVRRDALEFAVHNRGVGAAEEDVLNTAEVFEHWLLTGQRIIDTQHNREDSGLPF